MSDRYVATYTFPPGFEVEVMDGIRIARGRPDHPREYAIVFASSLADALRYARGLGIVEGAIAVAVAKESSEHNIPRLDPVAWKKREEECAELNRRCRR